MKKNSLLNFIAACFLTLPGGVPSISNAQSYTAPSTQGCNAALSEENPEYQTSSSSYTCPSETPVDCGNGQCCPANYLCKGLMCCPEKYPYYCGYGTCATSASTCPDPNSTSTTTTSIPEGCRPGYPVACDDGHCCPAGTVCPYGNDLQNTAACCPPNKPAWCIFEHECAESEALCEGLCSAERVLEKGNPALEQIRDFRDSTLAQSAVGRKIIQVYYNNTDSINDVLDRSPALRAGARWVILVIAPMLGNKK
jgi:hypothetical protein